MKPPLIVGLLLALAGILAAGALAERVWAELQFSMSRIELPVPSEGALRGLPIQVAVIGDLQVGHGIMDLDALQRLFDAVIAEHPDMIVLVGDYVGTGEGINQLRSAIVASIRDVSVRIPTYVVLGNHDNSTDAEAWLETFRRAGVSILENEVIVTNIDAARVCVRGLGDYYSGRFEWVSWPENCLGSIKVTLTHDPAGAFLRPMEGITFAGHTHCGQLRFPVVGALWIPTTAPREATCGIYRDPDRTLYVTSGVGTSILPLRFGAPSTWDMVTLVAMPGNMDNEPPRICRGLHFLKGWSNEQTQILSPGDPMIRPDHLQLPKLPYYTLALQRNGQYVDCSPRVNERQFTRKTPR